MTVDLRIVDNSALERIGVLREWQLDWAEFLNEIEHPDRIQERWSLSKRSYLAGYLKAKEGSK